MANKITLDEAIDIHKMTINYSGGGTLGQLDTGKLDSVLQNIQNDDYYPSFAEKLTHLFFCACEFHCFEDGNKRIAITLPLKLLIDNGYSHIAMTFLRVCENITYHVAAGKIKKDLLLEIITAILNETYEYDEELKSKILTVIMEW